MMIFNSMIKIRDRALEVSRKATAWYMQGYESDHNTTE